MHNDPVNPESAMPATKADLALLRTDLTQLRRDTAAEFLAVRGEMRSGFDRMETMLMSFRSDMLRACENAVFKAEKVDRDQTLTRDRLNQHEARLKRLEDA